MEKKKNIEAWNFGHESFDFFLKEKKSIFLGREMLCPELTVFRKSAPRKCTATGKGEFRSVKLQDFTTDIKFVVPRAFHLSPKIKELLTDDTEFYKATNFKIESLVDETFLKAFIDHGRLHLFSKNEPARLSPNLQVSSDGILRLTLPNEILPYLGLAVNYVTDKVLGLSVAEVNLKNLLKNPTRRQELGRILRDKLDVPGPFYLSWKPNSDDICPSSIAKYLHDAGVDIEEQSTEIKYTRVEVCPSLTEELSIEDIETWTGSKLMKIPSEKLGIPEENCQCLIAHCKGFFLNSLLKELLVELRKTLTAPVSVNFASIIYFDSQLYFPAKCLKKRQKNSPLLEMKRLTVLLTKDDEYRIKETLFPLS